MNTNTLDKINELISLKEFDVAKASLETLLDNEPNNIEALKLLGLCNINLELYEEGRNNFETVVKYKNDDATSWFYLASCYDNLEDLRHAKSAYIEVIKLRDNYLDAYKNLGVVYIKNQEPQKAIDIATKALEFVQDDYLLYYICGTALLALKEFEKSIEYFDKALELNPQHAQIHNNLGTAYLTLGNYNKAYEHYIKSSTLNPKSSVTFYNLASILQIQKKHKEAVEYFKKAFAIEPTENYLVSLALAEFRAGQFEAATHHYKILAAKHPEKHNFQYNLACCYEKIEDYRSAINILNPLVLLNQKSKTMLLKLANLYLKINDPHNAKEIYERLIRQGIVSDEIYYEYALICVQTNNLDIAEPILKKVIALNPAFAKAHKDLGVIYLDKRLFEYARDEFEKAYEIAPEDKIIIFEYANFLYSTSEFARAQELYDKVLATEPNDVNALIFGSLNLVSLQKLEEALDYIQRALKFLPDQPFALFLAGRIYHALNDYENAQIYLIKSWEIEKTVDVENVLGLNYFAKGEYEKANDIFLKLLKKNPMNTILLLNSAKCYEKLSDIEAAKNQLDKLLGIFPEMEEAQEFLEKLNNSAR